MKMRQQTIHGWRRALGAIVAMCALAFFSGHVAPGSAAPPGLYQRPANAFALPDFPPGLPWFNVDHPLSIRGLQGKMVLLDFFTYG